MGLSDYNQINRRMLAFHTWDRVLAIVVIDKTVLVKWLTSEDPM